MPAHWKINKFKFATELNTLHATTNDGYIAMENIESWTGSRIGEQVIATGETLATKTGDVLFGKLRPYLAKSYIVEKDGCCSTEFLVMKPVVITNQYLHYCLLSPEFVNQVDVSTYGAKMPRASWNYIGNMMIPVPPIDEQKAITACLDHKCKMISDAIDNRNKIITKLEEYKKSLIYNAVTGKIDCRETISENS